LTIGVAGLGTVLLGGATWNEIALAGLVDVHDGAALDVADALFASRQAPHAGIYF
jgi:hypothetical protein